MKKIIVLIEPLEKNAPEELWKIAYRVREDIQEDINGLEYDESQDPELIVEDTFGGLIDTPQGSYLSRDIIEDLDNYYHFTGEWVEPQRYDELIAIIQKDESNHQGRLIDIQDFRQKLKAAICPFCGKKLEWYDGALGYEALKCYTCKIAVDNNGLQINDEPVVI